MIHMFISVGELEPEAGPFFRDPGPLNRFKGKGARADKINL